MAMAYDAFSAGVEPGGLRTQSEIKLLVCYLIRTINAPLDRDIIYRSLQQDGLANYFEIGPAISDLVKNNCLTVQQEGETECYMLTEEGQEASETLEHIVPLSVRKKAVKAAVRSLYRRRNEKETRFQTEKRENGVFLTCTVLEADGSEMMSIRVKVADTYQAEVIKEQFLNNPGLIYRGTLALLIGDVDSVGGFAALADGQDI